ncbi:MAG: cell division protein FtsI [Lachnospiraceae bacterium]|nr:cell division protein FtsI [Lachnospiraceae bacterium]
MARRIRTVKKFSNWMQKKLLVLFFLVALCFIGLGVRIYGINKNNGEEYKKQVLSQQAYDSKVIDFKRGTIYDAKGTILADSELVYDVIIDAKLILEKPYYMEPTMRMLEEMGIDTAKVREYIIQNPSSQYYIAYKNLPYKEKTAYDEKLRKGREDEEERKVKREDRIYENVKGIWFDEKYIRTYPNGSLASDVIGFTNGVNEGTFGLEEYYNEILNGKPGRQYGYLDEMSNLERTTIDATNGSNLVSTLDANIQSVVEKHLYAFNEEYKDNQHNGNGASNVGAIVMNVKTGEIYAMASYPNFDLNNPYNTDVLVGMPKLNEKDAPIYEFLTEEDVAALSDEDEVRYLNQLWKNYCIGDYYEPGSVAKLLTVASGLESGAMTGHEGYQCNGFLEIGDWTIKCHNTYGDGYLTVSQAVECSCNVALMQMAFAQGKETFTKFQNIFNLGLRTNIDLAGEARTDGFIYKAQNMGLADLATNSFGQNYNVTMIQMAAAFASLVNGGNYYEPHLVSKITGASGATIRNIEPRILKKTVSPETSAKIREYCKQVVIGENGTGKTARPAGYIIGGKTGTAETIPRDNGQYVVSFMGFAPVDDPQVMVYVVVDRPNFWKQDDAKFATRIVRSIFTEVLPYLNIYMTEPLTAEEEEELAALDLTSTYHKQQEEEAESTGETTSEETEEETPEEPVEPLPEGVTAPDSQWITTESGESIPIWKTFPMDPATGYYINPDNGDMIDPDTGYVYGSSSGAQEHAPGIDAPVVEQIPEQ